MNTSYIEHQKKLDALQYIDKEHTCITLKYTEDNPSKYEIGFEKLESKEDILTWVYHLTEKTWMNTDRIRHFIELSCSYLDISPYDN